MKNEEAQQICNGVARLAEAGELHTIFTPGLDTVLTPKGNTKHQRWTTRSADQQPIDSEFCQFGFPKKIYNLKLGENSELTQFAEFSADGTCSSSSVYNISLAPKSESEPDDERRICDNREDVPPDPDDTMHLIGSGASEVPAVYMGRPILILGEHIPALVSWIRPNGRTRPLCVLEMVSEKKIVDVSKDKEACAKIAAGEVPPKPWQASTVPIRNETDIGGDWPRFTKQDEGIQFLSVDLDADGVEEKIAKFVNDSGAGCGSHREWLAAMSESMDRIKLGRTDDLLKAIHGSSINFFRVHEQYFVEQRDVDGIRSHIFELKGGKAEEVCLLYNTPESRIKASFGFP